MLPQDNEKARCPFLGGSVSYMDGDNEKARNTPLGDTPLGDILTLGSSVLSRPLWLKALSSRSPKFSPALLPRIGGNTYQSQNTVRAPLRQMRYLITFTALWRGDPSNGPGVLSLLLITFIIQEK